MPVFFADLARTRALTVAVDTIAAVVSLESNFSPLAIRIKSGPPLPESPRNKAQAIEIATTLLARHRKADLGFGGIDVADLDALDLTVADAFDPCLKLTATAELLNRDYRVAIENGAMPAMAENVMMQSNYGRGNALIGEMAGFGARFRREAKRLSPKLATLAIRPSRSPASGDVTKPGSLAQQGNPGGAGLSHLAED